MVKRRKTVVLPRPSLLDVRLATGLSQTQFWGRVGVTQSGGSRYEQNHRRVPKSVRLLLELTYGTAMLEELRSGELAERL